MKASTLFAITIAALLGLAVVGLAKYAGLFSRAALPPPEEMPKLLVASQNVYEGMAITSKDVRIRPATRREKAQYEANPEKYMPPIVEAANLRVLTRNIEAGQPLLREYFEEQGIPEALNRRLEPGMRAVNVSLQKDEAGGGLIQIGEHVDVFLTAQVALDGNWSEADIHTACIARDLKVIVKRNMLWTAMMSSPEHLPVQFTLQANPYRAALIEFAKQKGDLALVPTPAHPGRKSRVRPAAGGLPVYSDPESKEYRDEDIRVATFMNGELSVGDTDLERIFNLSRPLPPIRTEQYTGLTLTKVAAFARESGQTESATPTRTDGKRPTRGFNFRSPRSKDQQTPTDINVGPNGKER